MEEQIGAIIEQGPEDWQIVQQDELGEGRIELQGRRRQARVELVLQRPLQGAAKGPGGYGKAPATVPADMERFLPMLGFWGVEVA